METREDDHTLLLFKIVIKYSAKQEKATSGIVALILFLGHVHICMFFSSHT